MTGFGCFRGCAFCVAGKFYKKMGSVIRYVNPETAARDILNRSEKKIYLLVLNFSAYSVKRLESICYSFKDFDINKEFVVESRVDDITKERLRLFKQLGVTTIKLGIEGLTNNLLDFFEKKQSVNQIKVAVSMIKDFNMKFIAYILVGGLNNDSDYEITKNILMELEPDHVVVSIWAYQLDRDYRYDTQFSPVTLKNWGIKKEIFYDFLALQKEDNPTVGKIIS
jgi:oxygen-independent coproporphyrinogen-3 oxidase